VGYFQNIERDINREYLKQEGIDLVRRPTGGRAVLHDHELTYSITLPENFLPPGVIPSYMKIAQVFVKALKDLGLEPEIKGPESRSEKTGICFASRSAYEIAVKGRKILGSAQVRRGGMVLQHGSLLLSVDYEQQARCMKGMSSVTAAELEEKMTGLFQERGRESIERIIEHITDSFREIFDIKIMAIDSAHYFL
jgi:lipoate-protein ligase A